MFKIQILENSPIPERVPVSHYPNTSNEFYQYRVKLRSFKIDELLERIVDAGGDNDFCYFEFKDLAGLEHSYPILAGWKQNESYANGQEEVLYLDLMVF